MKFTELGLDERVMAGITDAGFTECTPVQEQTFGYTLKGKDVLVQSQTGTGKTAAFLITIFQNFLNGQRSGTSLVVVPTRELAVQIEEEARLLGGHTGMRIVSVYGGVGYDKQEEQLARGVDLLIATPGRLLDFGKSKKIKFAEVMNLVIDEADRMFDMGFYPDIQMMMKKMPPLAQRQTMLFSATLSTRVRNLAWEYMNTPGEIEISPENITVEQISQELYHVSKDEKLKVLLGILKRDNPENCLIFCNTKYMSVELAWRLSENGYKCQYIMGDLPQKKRLNVIEKLKAGKIPFLVATDVAARGLHIDDLAMVVNYDVPEDFENYVHRIGRTARAGKSGKAVTLACEKFVYGLPAIEDYIKMKIPVGWVSEDLLVTDVTAGKPFRNPDKDYIRRDDKGGRGRDGKGPLRGRREERPREERAKRSYAKIDKPAYPVSKSSGTEEGAAVLPGDRGRRSRPDKKSGFREDKILNLKKPGPDSTEEERIAYYKAKYGEDFKMPRTRGGKGKPRDGRKEAKPRNSEPSSSASAQKGKPAASYTKSSKPSPAGGGERKLNSYPAHFKAEKSGKKDRAQGSTDGKKKGFIGRLLDRFKKDTP
jgi:ATP-dependent RNA helicase RhlB